MMQAANNAALRTAIGAAGLAGGNSFTGLQVITGTTGTQLSIVGTNSTANLSCGIYGLVLDEAFLATRLFIANNTLTAVVYLDSLVDGEFSAKALSGNPLTFKVFGDATKYAALTHDGTNARLSTNSGGVGVAPSVYPLAFANPQTTNADIYVNEAILKVTMTGATTLNVPTNGVEGQKLEYQFTASGGNRALTFHASLAFPSDYTPTNPVTIASGLTRIVQLQKGPSAWMVLTNLGDYAA